MTAKQAVNKLMEAIKKEEGHQKRLTIAFFQKSSLVKEWDKFKPLPPDDPSHF